MSEPEILTTAHVVDKETLLRYGEEFGRHIAMQLGQRIAERIYQECQKGERIVSVGEPYSQDIRELDRVETRVNVRVQELVRCKDCCYWLGVAQEEHAPCKVHANVFAVTPRDGFCYKGMRRE